MEDGVTDTDFLDSSMDNNHVSRGDQEEEERNTRDKAEVEEKRVGGLIKSILSNLFSGGKENEEEDREKSGVVSEGKGKDEDKGDGVLNHLIPNLVSPLNNQTEEEGNGGKVDDTQVKEEGKVSDGGWRSEEDVGGGGGGGMINNLISNIFHRREGGGEKECSEKAENGKEKTEEEGGSGEGSIIDNIVSHFPTPLAGYQDHA
ncbi:uncharacterized protein LOC132313346 isoform X2 [Cornus florida]|uniref:uncharacterized protein LOC132313346 isoform X2 n=1 Tax=Cornus florida TaxID=4283 RepID=UPI00289E1C94|nr:uncharacterized protein LOC132313346 isoform X2 [Cornus florida]